MITKAIKILVVDDDEDDVLIIQDALSDLPGRPIRMEWISSFEAAISMIKARRHDAYLVDYRLGRKTGLDLISEVRIFTDSPVILLTGLWDRSLDVEAMKRGADDFLVKSELSPTNLERSIRYAINGRKSLRSSNVVRSPYAGFTTNGCRWKRKFCSKIAWLQSASWPQASLMKSELRSE
jgi:DNA-binding response OmpR family regulator